MNINFKFISETRDMHLYYDTETKLLFFEADLAVRSVYRSLFLSLPKDSGPEFIRGSVTLTRLAEEEKAEINWQEARDTLALLCWTTIYFCRARKDLGSLPSVMVTLASLAHIEVPDFALPPAAEIFDRQRCSEIARCGYEELRALSHSGPRYLFLLPAHSIWIELRQIPAARTLLREFLALLGTSTRLYHVALSALVEAGYARQSD